MKSVTVYREPSRQPSGRLLWIPLTAFFKVSAWAEAERKAAHATALIPEDID